MGYEFLWGNLILAFVFAIGFILRKDLRKPMVWSGIFYVAVLAIGFSIFKVGQIFFPIVPTRTIVPGYWEPKTLFNLGKFTGGFGIEDAIFMFFIGGIAANLYETFFKKRIKAVKKPHRHLRAFLIAGFASSLFSIFTDYNLIYSLIIFGFAGAFVIWRERPDLITHSVKGGVAFLTVYVISFWVFNQFFPNFVVENYNFGSISGVLVFGIPLEEFFYSLSFGLMWAPIYEYEHGEKDINL